MVKNQDRKGSIDHIGREGVEREMENWYGGEEGSELAIFSKAIYDSPPPRESINPVLGFCGR